MQADSLRQQPRRAEVEAQAPLGEDQREAGSGRAPHHVGCESHSQAGAHGHPVHFGDHRPGAVVDGHHGVADVAHVVDPVPARLVTGLPFIAGTDVGASAEVASGAGENDRPRRRLGDVAEAVAQSGPHGRCAGVLAAGPVDGDGGDRTRCLDSDVGVGHGGLRRARLRRVRRDAPDHDATQPGPRALPAPPRLRRRQLSVPDPAPAPDPAAPAGPRRAGRRRGVRA